jgi:hypothetical protein
VVQVAEAQEPKVAKLLAKLTAEQQKVVQRVLAANPKLTLEEALQELQAAGL